MSSFGYVLASLVASRMCSAGIASAMRITSASRPTGHGRRVTKALQRAAKPVSAFARSSPGSPCPAAGLMRRPIRLPSSAGISVSDASIVKSTDSAAPIAGPYRNEMPSSIMPSIAITTTMPANSTARPAVSSAVSVASRESRPPPRSSRNRLRISSA